MSTDEQKKDQARRLGKGEPLSNPEVAGNMDAAKQRILERGSERGSDELAQDVSHLVDQGKVFLQEKNPNQELQKIQKAGKKLVENAPAAGKVGSAQRQYFDNMSQRYNDLADLSSRIAFSKGMRRTTKRVLLILLESLSSAVSQGEQKLQSDMQQTGLQDQSRTHQSDMQQTGFQDQSGTHQYDMHQTGLQDQSGTHQSDMQQTGFQDQSGTHQSRTQGFGDEYPQGDFEGAVQGGHHRTGSAYESGAMQSEHKDQQRDTALSGPDAFGYDSHQPDVSEGAVEGEHHRYQSGSGTGAQGFQSGSGSGAQSQSQHGFTQRDTEHTRKNYKVFIRGQEFDFLNEDLSTDRKEWIAEEAQNICIDIASDEYLKESASAFVRVLKSASQMEVEKPNLSPEASNALEDMKKNLAALLDHMADDYDFCRMEKAWDCFIEKIKRNDELERDWKDLFSFLKESFLSKKLAMSNDWKDTLLHKQDCLRSHLMSIKPELFNLLQEFDCLLTALKDDKFISETSNSVEKLSNDLFLDKGGNFEFKPEALNQIRDIIVPEIVEQFKYIAIPDFRDEDDSQFSQISNAVLRSEGLFPEDVLIQNTTDLRLTRKNDNVLKTSIHVLIKGMNFDIQGMHVNYQRKVFPQIKDEGDFNIRSTGKKGIRIEMWLSASADNAELFKVDDVDVSISGLNIYDSHVKEYTFLFTIFKPLLQTMMRTQMQKAVESKIKETLFDLRALKGL